MTIQRAINVNVQLDADDDLVEKSLSDVQMGDNNPVDMQDEYDSSVHMAIVDMASIEVLKCLMTIPDRTEGGLSLKYDKIRMQKRLDYLEVKQGVYVQVDAETITDKSDLW